MTAPGWSRALLRRLAPADRAEDVIGDLEEAHRRRLQKGGRVRAAVMTSLEALDVSLAMVRERRARRGSRRPIGLERGSEHVRPGGALKFSWLDFKLGFRMLVRYPGLTLVGALAMAFAIWLGAGTFEFVTQVVNPRLPLPDGDRIVGLQNWDASISRVRSQSLHDYVVWRDELDSVEDVGAFRTVERNLITGDAVEPVEVAEISASAFRVTRVPPLLGRALVPADERPDAPAVAVIGYDVWRSRFAADPDVVGTVVRLGNMPTTVVGVMPEGYAFPVSQSMWVPLRVRAADYARGAGPSIRVFGRLAAGASMSEAQAELATLGRRAAADHPSTNEHLRPRVVPYAASILNLSGVEAAVLMSSNLLLIMLLVLICGNVALLMFARAATRESEIVVRNALGASRGRIVTQLFAEALVLGTLAAVLGLSAAGYGLRWGLSAAQAELMNGAKLPFWFHGSLSPSTIAYAVLLTLLSAAIAGVLPALKITRGLQARLRETTSGSGLQLGGVWTVVLIAQVAVTVAFPAIAWVTQRDARQIRAVDVGFPAEEFLSVRLEMDRELRPGVPAAATQAEFTSRFATTFEELESRITAEPAVTAVTFADRLPRAAHPHALVDVDAGGAAPLHPQWPAYRVSWANVGLDFFDVLSTPLIAGRRFHPGDVDSDQGVVIVNEAYVERVLGGRNPIGRRLRYVFFDGRDGESLEDEPWYEIVGVVGDMGMGDGFDPKAARIYHPTAPGGVYPASLAIRVQGDPESFIPRLRQIAAAADPTLRLYEPMAMSRATEATLQYIGFWFRLLLAVSSIALLLSLTGIYSVMSFTVARRTREIGIRAALGADPRRIVLAIFSRSLGQVAVGVGVGAVLAALMAFATSGGVSVTGAALVTAYAVLMMGVCALACIVPTRRALRIQPTEAMRAEG